MELLSSATVWMSDLMVMLVVNCQLYWRLQYWVQLSVCAVSWMVEYNGCVSGSMWEEVVHYIPGGVFCTTSASIWSLSDSWLPKYISFVCLHNIIACSWIARLDYYRLLWWLLLRSSTSYAKLTSYSRSIFSWVSFLMLPMLRSHGYQSLWIILYVGSLWNTSSITTTQRPSIAPAGYKRWLISAHSLRRGMYI